MNRITFLFVVVMLLLASGCRSHLAAPMMVEIVGKTVTDGVIGKLAFDPVWVFFFGNPNLRELDAVKNDFVQVATDKVLKAMIPSAHAGEIEFQCEPKEPQEECRNRAASIAEYQFNIYATGFVAAFKQCRDEIVLTPATGALDYTKQVNLITQCVSESGYQKEVALILAHIQGDHT